MAQRLLTQVLAAARAAGMGQAELARRAGLSPETLSRAKKRSNMDVGTLEALANALGLHVTLRPSAPAQAAETVDRPPIPSAPAALSHPRFGLAWSNPQAGEAVLLRRALASGRFDAVLESARRDGLAFVKARLAELEGAGELTPGSLARARRLVDNIEKGFLHGSGHAMAA